MRIGTVLNLLGKLLIALALVLLVPIPVSLYYHDNSIFPFVLSSLTSFACGLLLIAPFRPRQDLGVKDGFIIVVLTWLGIAAVGALPYQFAGVMPSYVDCFFESVSGFTTTGSSILTDVEALPKSLLFWRALTHWLGGMGIVVLGLAILPLLKVGGMQLFEAEVAGPTADRLAPRIQDTARILWGLYLLLTVLMTLLLMLGGVNLFDALTHTFAALATGGFSTYNASVAQFNSLYVELVLMLTMFLGGTNFTLHYLALHGRPKAYWKNEEFRSYVILYLTAIALLTLLNALSGTYESLGRNLRDSAFQLVTLATTTGFATADYDTWPEFCRLLILLMMCIGGCAGSTSGGLKVVRFLLFFKIARNQILHMIHPRQTLAIKLDGKTVPQDIVVAVLGFLLFYMIVLLSCSLALTAMNIDLITSVSAVIATINGVGPGLSKVGPMQNFAHLPDLAKIVLCGSMLAGRLEFYALAVLLTPDFWNMVRPPLWRWHRETAIKP